MFFVTTYLFISLFRHSLKLMCLSSEYLLALFNETMLYTKQSIICGLTISKIRNIVLSLRDRRRKYIKVKEGLASRGKMAGHVSTTVPAFHIRKHATTQCTNKVFVDVGRQVLTYLHLR